MSPYEKRRRVCVRAGIFLFVLCVAALYWLDTGLDVDSFWMIPRGEQILQGDLYTDRTSMFHIPDVPVQQWLWCVLLALCARVPENAGLLALMLIQAAALYLLVERRLARQVHDPFWSGTLAAALCFLPAPRYFASLRPENLTLILLLLQCEASEKYRETKRPVFLAALPVLTLAEANLHGSMALMHLAVWIAYLLKPPKMHCLDRRILIYTPAVLTTAGMSLACLCTPWGLRPALLPLTSAQTWNIIEISEQKPPPVLSLDGVLILLAGLLFLELLTQRNLDSVTSNMAAGLLLLSALSLHACMFLTLAGLFLLERAFETSPRTLPDIRTVLRRLAAPCGLTVLAAAVLFTALTIPASLPGADVRPEMDAAADRLLAEPGITISEPTLGSCMEYRGVTELFTDSRHENLSRRVNGQEEHLQTWARLRTGATTLTEEEKYPGIGDWLDAVHADYVLDREENPVYMHLDGWLEHSPDWEKVPLDGASSCVLWARKEALP